MEPKEKALSLCQIIGITIILNTGNCKLVKQLSLIVAYECQKEAYKQGDEITGIPRQQYWEDVKKEIILL